MKKICLLIALFAVCTTAFSQEEDSKPAKSRSSYVNIGYAESKLNQDDFSQLKSEWGASFTIGKTFYLHKKPILKFIKFGIDASWLDLTYANYEVKPYFEKKETFHHAEAAIHVGPSITLTPVNGLNLCGYFRYAPTFSAMYGGDTFKCAYATRFVGGASLSYKAIGVGFESRFGNSKFTPFYAFFDEVEDAGKIKTKLTGFRVYVTFRY